MKSAKCYNCGKKGHIAKFCRKKKDDKKDDEKDENEASGDEKSKWNKTA